MSEVKYYKWKDLINDFGLEYKALKRWLQNNFDEEEISWPKKGHKTIFTSTEYEKIKQKLT